MAEILFLWFGIVALVYAADLYDRDSSLFPAVGLIGAASIAVYIVSVFVTLPS